MPSILRSIKRIADEKVSFLKGSLRNTIVMGENESLGGNRYDKTHEKDGGTKQKGKNKPKQKTSGSANGQNGYH